MWDEVAIMALGVWPGVVILSALLNMLISWTYSWSELFVAYFIGLFIGIFFVAGTEADPSWFTSFMMSASLGLFGFLKWFGIESLADPETLFWWSAGAMVIGTVWSAALDHGANELGVGVGGWFFSLLLLPVKATSAMITSVVGLVVVIIGFIVRGAKSSDNGDKWLAMVGGVLFMGWGGVGTGERATTFGGVANVFEGTITQVAPHELYHSRQYLYMHDWLGIFYFTFAALWGVISAKIYADTKGKSFDGGLAFKAEVKGFREVGNPIEAAAYRLAP